MVVVMETATASFTCSIRRPVVSSKPEKKEPVLFAAALTTFLTLSIPVGIVLGYAGALIIKARP